MFVGSVGDGFYLGVVEMDMYLISGGDWLVNILSGLKFVLSENYRLCFCVLQLRIIDSMFFMVHLLRVVIPTTVRLPTIV